MTVRFRWNTIKIQIEQALRDGHITLELPTERDAKNFTYAVYNFRRKRGIGKEIRLSKDGKFVTIFKPAEILIKVKTEEEKAA